jgi:hypothetical protein
MAQSEELSSRRIVTTDGIVTTTVLDTVSPDRISLMLFKGAAAAHYGQKVDNTGLVQRDIKDLLVFPFSEL